MRQLFPSWSARKGNLLKGLKDDEKKKGMVYHCAQCGMPCNTNKVKTVQKDAGGDLDTVTITTAAYTPSGGSEYYYPETVQPKANVCPFCGSSRSKT